MARSISRDYQMARKLLSGARDPSGLALRFMRDGERVAAKTRIAAEQAGGARTIASGPLSALCEETAHATVAALKERVGITREVRLALLKPIYAEKAVTALGTIVRTSDALFVVRIQLIDEGGHTAGDAEVELFALSAAQFRRMSPDGMLPHELRRYFPG